MVCGLSLGISVTSGLKRNGLIQDSTVERLKLLMALSQIRVFWNTPCCVPLAKLEVHQRGLSDHFPLSLSCVSTDFGPIHFKFFNSWVDDSKLAEIVNSITVIPNSGDKQDVFLAKSLKTIKLEIKKWRVEAKEAENKERKEMTDKIE